jgi:hypothetical protein
MPREGPRAAVSVGRRSQGGPRDSQTPDGNRSAPIATLGHAYGVAGRRDEASKILGELETASAKKYVSPYFIALVHLGLEQDDRVFVFLDAAYQERHPYLTLLKVEPVFDRVRADSRFVALVKRVGLSP